MEGLPGLTVSTVLPEVRNTSEALQEARSRTCTKTLRFWFCFVKQTFLVSFLPSLSVAKPRRLSLRTRHLLELAALRLKTTASLAHRAAALRGLGSHLRRRARCSARALDPNITCGAHRQGSGAGQPRTAALTRTLRPGRPRTFICSFSTFEQWPEGPRIRSRAPFFGARSEASGGSGSAREFMKAVSAYAAGAAPPWLRAGARLLGSGFIIRRCQSPQLLGQRRQSRARRHGLTWPLLAEPYCRAEQKPARERGRRGSALSAHVAVPERLVALAGSPNRSGASGPCALLSAPRGHSRLERAANAGGRRLLLYKRGAGS